MILATGLNRLFIGLMVVAVMFAVAMGALSYRPSADIISLIWYVIFSISMLFGFGMAVSGWAKNENQAAPLANLVSFPMMFLSGSFFPRFLMPQWLQRISDFLPLTPVIDGLRYILTESKTLFDLGPQLAIIAVWTVVIYIIAFKTFRWE
jgi:ABC-2 type transport system permease protein